MDRNTTTVLVTVLVLLGVAFCLKPPFGNAQDAPSMLKVVQGNDLAELIPTPQLTGDENPLIQRVQHASTVSDSVAARINPFKSAPDTVETAPTIQPAPIVWPAAKNETPAVNEIRFRSEATSPAVATPATAPVSRKITRLPPPPMDLPAVAVEINLPKSDQVRDLEELLPGLKDPTNDAFAALDSIESAIGLDGESQTEFDADSIDIAENTPATLSDELPPLLEPQFQPLDLETSQASRLREVPQVSKRLPFTRDLHQPLEADPGWVVDNNRDSVSRESILNIDMPRHVEARTMAMLRDATNLADRGALCAARQQFMRILRITCQTLDTQLGKPIHARGLANGLRALEEAEDFALTDNTPEADIHLMGYIQGHRTPVLKNADPNQITALMAMKRYYKYAYEQLALAGNNERVASEGLFALGRIESMLKNRKVAVKGGGPKALALYHAALTVNSRNGRAANELGVLLAKRGRSHDALYVLQQAAAIHPTTDVMSNLAVVHNQLSDPVNARMAQQQASQLAGNETTTGSEGNIQWVTPQEFAAISDGDAVKTVSAETPAAKRPASPTKERAPIRTATRPANDRTWDF